MIVGQGGPRRKDFADGGDVFAKVTQALFSAHATLVKRARAVAQHAGLQVHLEESQAFSRRRLSLIFSKAIARLSRHLPKRVRLGKPELYPYRTAPQLSVGVPARRVACVLVC
jgi:hypothetical protein